MKRTTPVLARIALATGCLLMIGSCSQSKLGPRATFDAFEQALAGGEHYKLNALSSKASLDYFSGLQPWILRGDEASIKGLSDFDRYMIYMIRMRLDFLERSDWEDWNESLLSEAKPHPIGGYLAELLDDAFFDTSLGTIESIGDVTAGRLLRKGAPVGVSLGFSLEDGEWKINLARFFRDRFDRQLKPYLSDRYRNRDRLWEMLTETYGERANRSLMASRLD